MMNDEIDGLGLKSITNRSLIIKFKNQQKSCIHKIYRFLHKKIEFKEQKK